MDTSNPYTAAYTRNLVASLERTRQELKNMLQNMTGDMPASSVRKLAAQMHRIVGSITDDLQDNGMSTDNHVYVMECGHEYDSSFRRTEGVMVTCSMHGQTRLIDGDFI